MPWFLVHSWAGPKDVSRWSWKFEVVRSTNSTIRKLIQKEVNPELETHAEIIELPKEIRAHVVGEYSKSLTGIFDMEGCALFMRLYLNAVENNQVRTESFKVEYQEVLV